MTSLIVASFHNRPQVLHFDPVRGEITLETLSKPDFDGYTWISAHPKHDGLFYALQRFSDAEGILSVIKIPTKTNTSDTGKHVTELKILKNYPSHGMDPCHLGVSPQGDSLAIANVNTSLSSATLSESAKERIIRQYDTSTVTIYKLDQDGMVDENVKPEIIDLSKEPFKTGPNAERQEAAHPHGCFYVPMLETYLVPDLGADKLRLIDKGKTLPCKAGAGPRHAVIHPQDNLAYIVNELDNTITIHDLAGDELPIASYSVLPSDVAIPGGIGMCASAIHATPDFRFIYITNRLESNPKGDAIVWFRIAEDGRSLQQQGKLRTGLDHPRAAEIFDCQDSLYYIVGSKTERGAVVYKIDAGSGALEEVARNMDVLSPSGFVRI